MCDSVKSNLTSARPCDLGLARQRVLAKQRALLHAYQEVGVILAE